ncbi:MAG TPA: endolytic transglycosylase MltG [Acidobacteriota bacterium]|nr:endolytic transglycosylase MltG [Acidobacteriota bacterium]
MRWKWIITIIVILGFGAAALAYAAYKPLLLSEPVTVTIAHGESTTAIAAQLEEHGALRSHRLFIWWARLRGVERHLQPGRYTFSGPTSMDDILDILRQGRRETVTVTIPEGWTIPRVAERLGAELEFSAEEFVALTEEQENLDRWGVPNSHMEGYLLPETYTFFWGAEPEEVLARLADGAEAVFVDSIEARVEAIGMTRHEVLTLASMVEAEAGIGDERPVIASVFHNRLRRRMLLQCDPTVIYAMGGLAPGHQLWSKNLEIDSPYNTYKHPGLPPGPICNPGEAAIMAALYADSTNYLYFVADGTGGHIFSRTLEEHNRARARVKRSGQGG